jgi:hypothetical protein
MITLDFNMRVLNGTLTTTESLRVALTLKNLEAEPAEIPSPYDRTDTLTFCVYDGAGKLVRSMNGLTGQAMMSRSRIDARKDFETLGPGKEWSWELDLCQFHYPLRAGEYYIAAVYRIPSEGTLLETPRARLHVTAAPLRAIARSMDNPVTERLHLLLTSGDGEKPVHTLRYYNLDTPLACWYSKRLPEDLHAGSFLISQANFFQTRSFDPAFAGWIVWQHGVWSKRGNFTGGTARCWGGDRQLLRGENSAPSILRRVG